MPPTFGGPVKLDTSTDPQVGYRPPGPLDAAAALDPYDGRFTERNAAHLLRRAGFGGTPTEITALAALGMTGAVDSLIHPSGPDADFPALPDQIDAYSRRIAALSTQHWWLDRMLRTRRPFVEKMALFWHGHFATSIRKVPAELMVGQIELFRAQGLGRFPALLLAVSQDPAMLVWLDNRANVKAHPNENYAREVMELFSLGLGNYTEDDVHNAARAFTGWGLDKNRAFLDRPRQHDDGPKTFLGHTGNFTGEDVIGIIVAQPISQRFIARKLLEFFVYSDPEPELIERTASVYALSGFDIAKTMGTILRSNVFYSTRAYRAIPKSPIEFTIGLLRYMGVTTIPTILPAVLARMGQEPLAPPNVKGWDGGPAWINTSTLLARFNFVNAMVALSGTPIQRMGKRFGAMADDRPMRASQQPLAAPLISPDVIVKAAGGYDAPRVVDVIVAAALQDDVTSDIRKTLIDYLTSTGTTPGTGTANAVAFSYENYQEKIRGALALTLNLPVNQLD